MLRRPLVFILFLCSCRGPELVSGHYTASIAYTAEDVKYMDDQYTLYISDSLVWIRNESNVHTYPITLVKGEFNLYSPPLYKIYFNQTKKYLQVKHRVRSSNTDYALPNEPYDLLYWLDGLKLVTGEIPDKRAD